ncbi:hypothetical protein [Aeoliella mucimassa]|uniref:Uncharacterized protein n=1 Tax=Aeoliella mucimassa TaxID=2527972 RepID=A0A518ATW6_9BACT|nr:hypothetical protein [Aeoliella mucimassa]QDU58146.1 hypothetical protein Pan181_43730 [Aeoliella mucimassa]
MGHRYAKWVVAAAVLLAVVRIASVASHTEYGWGLLSDQWQFALGTPVGLQHTPIGQCPPVDQAKFWLAETDRVVAEHPDSASLAMGAAWVLDSPGVDFMSGYMKSKEYPKAFPSMGMELDDEAIARATAEFRERCLPRCLELARRATELEPQNVDWWRMRALLEFEGDQFMSGLDFSPREADWLQVLEQCQQHDPDNALYDYLAAFSLWEQSASYDAFFPDDATQDEDFQRIDQQTRRLASTVSRTLAIHDESGFLQGCKRFEAGQQKAYLAFGEAGTPCIAELVSQSGAKQSDWPIVATNRLISYRQTWLYAMLSRWCMVQADDAILDGNIELAIDHKRQTLRLFEQAILPKETSALDLQLRYAVIREANYAGLLKIAEAFPDAISQAELDALKLRERQLRIDAATLTAALQTLHAEVYPEPFSTTREATYSAVASLSAGAMLYLALPLLLVGWLLARRGDTPSHLGFVRQCVAWLVGYGLTIVVLGMAPAEVISHAWQQRAIIGGIWLSAFAIAAGAAWILLRVIRRRQVRYQTRTLLAITTAIAVLAAQWPWVSWALAALAANPPELWVHARGFGGLDAEVIRAGTKLQTGSWMWAVLQWFAHLGHYVGLALSLLLVIGWYVLRSARQQREGWRLGFVPADRQRWSQLLRFAGRSAAGAAIVWLLVYAAIFSQAAALADAEFQYKMRYCRDPLAHYNEIVEAQATVKASPAKMTPIRQQVEFDLSDEELLQQYYGEEE